MSSKRRNIFPARSTLAVALGICLAGAVQADEKPVPVKADEPDPKPSSVRVAAGSGYNVSAERLDSIPVQRDIVSIALLAPGTVAGDPAFGNTVSFGGGAVSENQYFVNGFNVSNSFKNLDFSEVPFDAISEVQVRTGGYGVILGRGTGGVVNVNTRRGSNTFEAGAKLIYEPASLRGKDPDVFYADPRYPDGARRVSDNSQDTLGNSTRASVWAGGAPIKDRLFAYAVLGYNRMDNADSFGSIFDSRNSSSQRTRPDWLVKLDWNATDNQVLEFTAFSDRENAEREVYSNDVAARSSRYLTRIPAPAALTPATTDLPASLATDRDDYLGTIFDESGGENYILKYTAYATDTLTLSALYGHGESRRSSRGVTANGIVAEYSGRFGDSASGCPAIRSLVGAIPQSCSFMGVIGSTRSRDERDELRLHAEWTLARHNILVGVEANRFTSADGEAYEGGSVWQYRTDYRNASVQTPGVVRRRAFQYGAEVDVKSNAFYVEDTWQVTPEFQAYLGLRWDSFENTNDAGETFVEIHNQFSPRAGLAWDLHADGSMVLFANAGRYALPLSATIGTRGASPALFMEQFYTFTGVDPATGAPMGLVQTGSTRYLNNENGLPRDPRTIADQDLRPMFQDEFILGIQSRLSEHMTGGVRGIYRDLKSAIDDQCDYRPIYAYAADNQIPFVPVSQNFPACRLYNPGEDATFLIDIDGDGQLESVELDADVLGPRARRTYKALELFVEGYWGRSFVMASYTRSSSVGNTEGGVKSDIGQDDTGVTQDFDYPELMIGSFGHLPNDRKHSFKLIGAWQVNEQWSIGTNVLLQSGRPINCFGFLGGPNTSRYGNSYFSCDPGVANLPGDGPGNNGSTIVTRGSAGSTPWLHKLDLNVAYSPAWADGKLRLKADVFNVLDSHAVISVVEEGENSVGDPQPDAYGSAQAFQAPRSVRFSVEYRF